MLKKYIFHSFFSVAYFVVFLDSISAFYIFKPFIYIDNAASKIICNNGAEYETGWNFIYSLDGTFDEFNDIKARKICQHGAIKDYGNTLATPDNKNYRFEPTFIQESGWSDAILMFFAALFFGALLIEVCKIIILKSKNITVSFEKNKILVPFIGSILLAPLIFFLFLKNPASHIHCKRQVARKINNFKRIIFKYGIFPIPEEQKHLDYTAPMVYKECLREN